SALLHFLRDERVTIFNSVPSLWTRMLPVMERHSDPLPTVRWILLGGEALPAEPVRRWWARWGGTCRFANMYGSTETIVNATWFEVTEPPLGTHTPIGWARAGVDVHLLDVQDGVGEIAVGGDIAEEYLGAPVQTSERFVEHPEHGRVFQMGDLARRNPDGALVYVGRRDTQVQVRGNRVELGEIEHLLSEHPSVERAFVTQRPDGRLHAIVQGDPNIESLRNYLALRVPAYMSPHTWQTRDQLPMTPAGKLDRLALSAPVAPAPTLPDPASTDTDDSALARIWMDVLHLSDHPAPSDDFFALGGDSLLLLDVLERLRDQTGHAPSPLSIYSRPTLQAMATASAQRGEQPVATPSGPVPLTGVQRGFWFADHADPRHPPVWTASVPVRGLVHPSAMSNALRWLISRHDTLRMRCTDDLRQRCADTDGPWLEYDDLQRLTPAEQQDAVQRRRAELHDTVFDLRAGQLFRVRLCKLARDRNVLMIVAHHIIADAWSAWLLLGELLYAHDCYLEGRAISLPAAPQLRDHAPTDQDDSGFWSSNLADLPAVPIPDAGASSTTFHLDSRVWHQVVGHAKKLGCSPFALVFSHAAGALQRVFLEADIVLSTAVADRSPGTPQVGVVAPFARGVPVRITDSSPAAVTRALGLAMAHARVKPATYLDAVGPHAVARLSRFFFSWLDPRAVPGPPTSLTPDWSAGDYRFATASSRTETFFGAMIGEGLHLHVYGGSKARDVAEHLERSLRRLTAPDAALVVYLPDHVDQLPISRPLVVEDVACSVGRSQLVLLPRRSRDLVEGPDLEGAVREACRTTEARVVALAGVLPARTGLGTRELGALGQVVTTGHGATVVAMAMTVERLLGETRRQWRRMHVGVLGYGAIGRATQALLIDRLGQPGSWILCDPALSDSADNLDGADLILGATSGGHAIDPSALRPGTLVIDDSFPRAFDDIAAIERMRSRRDVLLVHGGAFDAGPLTRSSEFTQAEALRSRYGAEWLPGCHAEALLLSAVPTLSPTTGVVTLAQARAIWRAIEHVGWREAPLHLGPWEVPEDLIIGLRR
ncbi:MAG: hypothetical protein ACI9MC_002028, partial [Kiritimatiellia bacterium]